MLDYKNKYLKYKNKYVSLLKNFDQQIGGYGINHVFTSKDELRKAIESQSGPDEGVPNTWDVSAIIDMSDLFMNTTFDYNISNWKIDNVINMNNMFKNSKFNKPLK
jgi:hypothetical protein